METERAPAIARTPAFDDPPERRPGVEPQRKLGGLKADDEIGVLVELFVGKEEHALGRQIRGPIADEPTIAPPDAAAKTQRTTHLATAIGREPPARGTSEGGSEQAKRVRQVRHEGSSAVFGPRSYGRVRREGQVVYDIAASSTLAA
jgi:hypothetical protein